MGMEIIKMNIETRKFIEDLAEEIIKEKNIEIPIKDINKVVIQLGGDKINICAFDIYDESIGIKRNEDNSFVLKTSLRPFFSEEEKEEYNFLIAKLLGHLYLHMGYEVLPELWDEQDIDKFVEFIKDEQVRQATVFARAFLMPKKEYKRVLYENLDENNKIDVDKIAEYFNVTYWSAKIRGQFLGLIEW